MAWKLQRNQGALFGTRSPSPVFLKRSLLNKPNSLPSVRNGIPGKEGLFIISVTSGSLAEKTGVRVSIK